MYHKKIEIRITSMLYGADSDMGRFQVKVADGFSGPSFEMEIPVKESWELGEEAKDRFQDFINDKGMELVERALSHAAMEALRDGREDLLKAQREKAKKEAENHMEGFGE